MHTHLKTFHPCFKQEFTVATCIPCKYSKIHGDYIYSSFLYNIIGVMRQSIINFGFVLLYYTVIVKIIIYDSKRRKVIA